MFVGLAVDKPPHIEPGSGVGLRWVVRILELARRDYRDQITVGKDGDDLGVQPVARWRPRPSAKEPHDAFTA